MAYCTQTDIEGVLPLLSQILSGNTSISVANEISYADAEIDAALQGLCQVPFSVVPPIITNISRLLAASRIAMHSTAKLDEEHMAAANELAEEGRGLLERIRNGELALEGAGRTEPQERVSRIEFGGQYGHPVFSTQPEIAWGTKGQRSQTDDQARGVA